MTSNGKQFTVTREMLTAVAGISARFSKFAFVLFCYITNHLMTGPLGNSEFCFPQISMFPSTSSRETLRFSGNKIHCSPRDQSLSVKYISLLKDASVNDHTKFRAVPSEKPKGKGRPPKYYHPLLKKEKTISSVVHKILPKSIANTTGLSRQIETGSSLRPTKDAQNTTRYTSNFTCECRFPTTNLPRMIP